MCESLSAPLNGTISFQADATTTFDFRTTATYACDKGFSLSGGNPERTCEEGPTEGMGAWSGSAPTCSGKLILLYMHQIFVTVIICVSLFECMDALFHRNTV